MIKKVLIILVAIFAVCLQSLFAAEPDRAEYLKAFQQRMNSFIANFDTSSALSYNSIIARYHTGKDIARADAMFLKLLEQPNGDMFWMYPMITAYIVGKDKMAAEVKTAARKAWKTYAPSRGDTENHWAMYYTSLLLATEQWPDLPGSEWYNGRSSRENFVESREYLLEWTRITTTIGQGEFDSPDYFPMFFVPATMLAELAQDADMRKLGEMLADYFIADFAVEHLAQQYAGGHSRIYERGLMRFPLLASATVAYLYFGVGEPQASGWLLIPAITSYQLPEIIYRIATDRSVPYVHKERKRVRHVIRFGEERNPPVYKYTFMTKDYALGSLHGGILQPIQQHSWNVRYTFGQPFSVIFGLHPYWSVHEIGMFFPEQKRTSMAYITASKTTYNNPDKWTGGSPYERTFQHKNTLIVLDDIPAGTTSEHIDGFFPANLEKRIIDKSGWIMCKAGDTYIGWYPLQAGIWSEEYEIQNPAFAAPTGSKLNKDQGMLRNYRFRSHALQNGYVVEVRSKAEIGGFSNFKTRLKAQIPRAVLKPGSVSVDYTTMNKDRMQFAFPDQRILNGKKVDLSQYKLFEGPFLNAEVGSETLTLTYQDLKLVLDFKKLEKREK